MGKVKQPSYRSASAFRKRGVLDYAADLIWPARSLLSDAIVDRPGVIEPERWGELQFAPEPACFRCGFPLPLALGEENCGACAGDPPAYDCARAALVYDDHARRLVLELKRGGRRDGLPAFASSMAFAAASNRTGGFDRLRAHALDPPCRARL